MAKIFNMKIIPWFVVLFVTACEPLIFVNGRVFHEIKPQEMLIGHALLSNKTQLSGVQVTLRPAGNPNVGPGSKVVTDGEGYYKIIGVELRPWWNFHKEWEVVFQKEGYETVIVNLDIKKHKDPDSKLEYQYRVDAFLSQKK